MSKEIPKVDVKFDTRETATTVRQAFTENRT
jgi:hypothetical protein